MHPEPWRAAARVRHGPRPCIGAAAAEGLAIAGWHAVVHHRDSRASAEAVAARVRPADGRASCQQADLSSAADVASLVVAPIYTATEMAANVPAGGLERGVGSYRLGRMVRPEEVANVITYLLSPDARR